MNCSARLVATCVLAATALAISGCVSAETLQTRPATGVWGYVASATHASLELDPARASTVGMVFKRVVAPADSLVVVTANDPGGPGMEVGVAAVKRGETRDLKIPLTGVMTPSVTATLYLDRGRAGILDADPMDPASSADRPIFVGGKPVSVSTSLWQPGQAAKPVSATVDVFDQTEASSTLMVTHVAAPGPSWITVWTNVNDAPGALIGLAAIGATDTVDVPVTLTDPKYRGRTWVGLHVDAGVPGTLEYDRFGTLATSPDQLYTVSGQELLSDVQLR